MYSAPAVSYGVHRTPSHLLAIVGICCVAAIAGLLWAVQSSNLNWRHALMAVVLLVAFMIAVLCWQQLPQGQLRWESGTDASNWLWIADVGVGEKLQLSGTIVVHLDFQQILLLRHRDVAGQSRWLWVQRQTDPIRWPALRRAVYAPRSQVVPDGVSSGRL